ncbi:MAG: hypothetical protein Q4C45_08400 [Oscillospiraceae bacterium]|nr:hypothetical protein [Oscillospiraceae bacterium]
MASVFWIKGKIDSPMEWYANKMGCESAWEFDDILKSYHLGEIYIKECNGSISFEDTSENEFFAWQTSSWIAISDGQELVYGYYNGDAGNAEFVHIKNGTCIRDYRVYDFELDTDEGVSPEFHDWVDVAKYVDKELL